MKGLGRVASCAIAAIGLAFAGAINASAAVQCVSASGKVPAAQAKKLGCGATIYTTIGAGVGAAASGDTVAVFPGTYTEMVTITQSLQLLGQNAKKTIIDATGLTNGVLDSASAVTISGFTIQNANNEGIRVAGAAASCVGGPPPVCTPAGPPISGVTITDNIVINNDKALVTTPSLSCAGAADFEQDDCGEAVHLDGVTASTVAGNTVKGNAGGILLTDETNLNSGNLVNANNVANNVPDCGITLPSHPPNGSNANIGAQSFGVSDNTISNNTSNANGAAGVGIFAPTPGTSSEGHLVIGNTITNNTQPGVVFHSHAPGQFLSNNSIVSNTISGNGADANPGSGEIGPADPTGVEIFADVAASPLFESVTGNTINKETNDIWVGAPGWNNCPSPDAPCYNVNAHLNNLLGKGATGINNAGTAGAVLVAAPQNFWGCAKGPGQQGCTTATGSVNTTPFLTKTSK